MIAIATLLEADLLEKRLNRTLLVGADEVVQRTGYHGELRLP